MAPQSQMLLINCRCNYNKLSTNIVLWFRFVYVVQLGWEQNEKLIVINYI